MTKKELEKEAEEYIKANNLEWELECDRTSPIAEVSQAFHKGAEFGYNKAKEEAMMKLKDEGIVKPLKDSILRNERLSSQEQQELCAWIECAMDFGENLDECAKELEEANKANEWHYVKDEGTPKVEGHYLVCLRNKDRDIFDCWIYYDKDVGWYSMKVRMKDIYAWKEIVLPELPKESE